MATNRTRIDALIWVAVISLLYYGIKGGVFTIETGGVYKVLGPDGTIIGDNNQLALALLMTIPLVERLPRSIGAGIDYSTSLGFGATAFWEHRNLFGHAERLRITGEFAQSRLGLLTQFRRPDLGATDQDLLATAELADETPVTENGVRYAVDIKTGHKTGFYIDQRDNRRLVMEHAAGREMLAKLVAPRRSGLVLRRRRGHVP